MASALIEGLKTVATEAKRSQLEDAVSSSWAALAAEENWSKREQEGGGGGRGGGAREGEGGAGGRGEGSGGVGVEQRD